MTNPASNLALLLRTLPFLKTAQVVYQLRTRCQNRLPRRLVWRSLPRPDLVKGSRLSYTAAFLPRPRILLNDIRERRFSFLNQVVSLTAIMDWQVPEQSRLWRYNLHYFDYLLPDQPTGWENGCRLMVDWVDANPRGTPDAWDPYPTSLRIVNWIKFISIKSPQHSELLEKLLNSLYHQVLHLEHRMEYHLLANHLFKDIKALLFAGYFFEGVDAQRWRTLGLRLIRREIDEQVLPDGGHFERSPMYHAMLLEDVLDLLNILPKTAADQRALRSRLIGCAQNMIVFLSAMTHPDGQVALFNDAALGIEHPIDTLAGYFAAITGQAPYENLGGSLQSFAETGYFIMTPSDGNKLIVDCGPMGPDYQSGHGHCDTLSFELSVHHRRVIVDSGCCQYEDSPIRQYNRGNAGHNTVTIDGRNQSEVWNAHRCARRAYPVAAALNQDPDGALLFTGSHDGYRRLSGQPVHQRTIYWKDQLIVVKDEISGQDRHQVISTLHLHPDLDLHSDKGEIVLLAGSNPLVRISTPGNSPIHVLDGWYCPEFNRQITCKKLVITIQASLPVELGWHIELL